MSSSNIATPDCGGRYALKSQDARQERKARLTDLHIAPLERLADTIRATTKNAADVPSFDPCDGGLHAEVLLLLEAPGRRAVETGFVSMNNPDRTAANLFALVREAGIDRKRVLMWNVVPWYLGTTDHRKVRAARQNDIVVAAPYLQQLVALLPELQVCVLFGRAAQCAEILLSALLNIPCSAHPTPAP